MGFTSCLVTTVGAAFSLAGFVLSILSFLLPNWVYVEEILNMPRTSTTEVVHFHYNYGFWKYCSRISSSSGTSQICGDVVTHQVWEQVVVCLVLLAAILQVNAVFNGSLYLLIFKDETLCVYVAGSSSGVAGLLLLAGVLTYGAQNRNVLEMTETYVISFATSDLHVSFWCAVSSASISIMACILFLVSNINIATESHRIRFRSVRRMTTNIMRGSSRAVGQDSQYSVTQRGKNPMHSLNSTPVLINTYCGRRIEQSPNAKYMYITEKKSCIKPKFDFSSDEKVGENITTKCSSCLTLSDDPYLTRSMESEDNKLDIFQEMTTTMFSPSLVSLTPAENQAQEKSYCKYIVSGGILKGILSKQRVSHESNNHQRKQNSRRRSGDGKQPDGRLSKLNFNLRKVVIQQSSDYLPQYAWTTNKHLEMCNSPKDNDFL